MDMVAHPIGTYESKEARFLRTGSKNVQRDLRVATSHGRHGADNDVEALLPHQPPDRYQASHRPVVHPERYARCIHRVANDLRWYPNAVLGVDLSHPLSHHDRNRLAEMLVKVFD